MGHPPCPLWGGTPLFFGGSSLDFEGVPPPNLLRVLFFQGNIINKSLYLPLPPQGWGLAGGQGHLGSGFGVWGSGDVLWSLLGGYLHFTPGLLGPYSGFLRFLEVLPPSRPSPPRVVGVPPRVGGASPKVTPTLFQGYSRVTQAQLPLYSKAAPAQLCSCSCPTPALLHGSSAPTHSLLQRYSAPTPWLLRHYSAGGGCTSSP